MANILGYVKVLMSDDFDEYGVKMTLDLLRAKHDRVKYFWDEDSKKLYVIESSDCAEQDSK